MALVISFPPYVISDQRMRFKEIFLEVSRRKKKNIRWLDSLNLFNPIVTLRCTVMFKRKKSKMPI